MSEYNIGSKIKKLRLAKKLTLQAVARETGFSPALISQIENNNVSPPIATLSKIAKFFDVKIGMFFTEDEEEYRYEVVRRSERKLIPRVISRAGTSQGYSYESLSFRKQNKKMEPFLLSVTERVAEENRNKEVSEIKERLLREAIAIYEEDKDICRRIGENGAALLKNNSRVLTHCNAGGLATAGYGTALGVIFAAKEQGKKVSVYVDETRPLLQGSRLTAWELVQAGIETTLICDNMAASVMKDGKVDCVIVGADRIAANGDTANKIGTYGVSILAKEHGIPFYVAAPISTFDLKIPSGSEIPIEQRNAKEVTEPFGYRIAPKEGLNVYNPAFDVTPAKYIEAIITEKGVIMHPDKGKILLVHSLKDFRDS